MSVEAVVAVVSFVGLFAAWVVLPSRLCKKRAAQTEDETAEQCDD